MGARKHIGIGLGLAMCTLSATQAFGACFMDVKSVEDHGGGNITVTFSTHLRTNEDKTRDMGPYRDYTQDYSEATAQDIAYILSLRGGRPEAIGSTIMTKGTMDEIKDAACQNALKAAQYNIIRF